MKIKLSKSQWEFVGRRAGWIKKAEENSNQNDEQDVASLKDKMTEATRLAFQCAYKNITPDGYFHEEKKVDLPDEVWAWADGLTQEYYMKQMEGRTSIQNIIDFDIEKAEQQIDKDIELFKQTLEKVGAPKKLTPEEYRALGYKYP